LEELQTQYQQFYKLNTNVPYSAESNEKHCIVGGTLSVIFGAILLVAFIFVFLKLAIYEAPFFLIISIPGIMIILGIVFIIK